MPTSDLDLPALRAIAEKATQDWHGSADFYATFNPVTVLALINELDQLRAGWSPTDEMAVLGGELTLLAAKNKSLLDEIDRLKIVLDVIYRSKIDDNATLRSRIEELEKER
jgi:hypothetical protein